MINYGGFFWLIIFTYSYGISHGLEDTFVTIEY